MSERYALSNLSFNNTSDSNSYNNAATLQNPNPFSRPLQAPPSPITTDTLPPPLSCPVPSCSSVFAGEVPQRYLMRHLRHPGIKGRIGEEKAAWLNLHKVELNRLTTKRYASLSPINLHPRSCLDRVKQVNRSGTARLPKPKLGKKKLEEQKFWRASAFRLCVERMGITDMALIAEKLAIWEGMWAAREKGDSIGYDAWGLLDLATNP